MSIRESMPLAGGVAIGGRVLKGTVRAQSQGELIGFGPPIAVTVAALEQQGKAVLEVPAGQDVAMLLPGLAWQSLRKGQLLAMPGAFVAATRWIVDFTLARDDENPERNTPTFAPYPITISDVEGIFRLAKDGDPIPYAQKVRGTLELAEPLYLVPGVTSTIMWGGAIVGDLEAVGPAPAP